MRELTGSAAGTGGTCDCRGHTNHLQVQVPGRKPEATSTSLAKNYCGATMSSGDSRALPLLCLAGLRGKRN